MMFTTQEQIDMDGLGAACETPGMRIRSGGRGRGMARGRGPFGGGLGVIMDDSKFNRLKIYLKWGSIVGGGLLVVAALGLLHAKKRKR